MEQDLITSIAKSAGSLGLALTFCFYLVKYLLKTTEKREEKMSDLLVEARKELKDSRDKFESSLIEIHSQTISVMTKSEETLARVDETISNHNEAINFCKSKGLSLSAGG